ncbi:hypothetical protein D9M71_502760 [compost metagenome]
MLDLDAELVLVALHQGWGTGRAADHHALDARQGRAVLLHVLQNTEPHGGDARREGDALALEQFEDAFAIQRRPREDQLGANQRRRVRKSPGVDVKHRHHGGDHVASGQGQGVGQRARQSVQQGRAVGVEHALGVARGARGVAEGRRRVFIEPGPGEIRGLLVQQVLVAQQVRDVRARHVRTVGHGDPVLHARALGCYGFDQRCKAQVEADDTIFGVVDYPADLLRKQAGIDGMSDRPHA